MTDNPYAQFDPHPAQPVPPSRPRRWPWIVALPVMFLAGIGVGISDSEPAAVGVETETVEVESTPQACLNALDLADEGFGYASDGMTAAGRGFDAASRFDVDGILSAADDIGDVTEQLNALAPEYNQAKAECREEG